MLVKRCLKGVPSVCKTGNNEVLNVREFRNPQTVISTPSCIILPVPLTKGYPGIPKDLRSQPGAAAVGTAKVSKQPGQSRLTLYFTHFLMSGVHTFFVTEFPAGIWIHRAAGPLRERPASISFGPAQIRAAQREAATRPHVILSRCFSQTNQ